MSLKGIKLCLVKMHFFSNKPFGKVKYLKYPGIFPQVCFLKCKFIQIILFLQSQLSVFEMFVIEVRFAGMEKEDQVNDVSQARFLCIKKLL